jgi:rod shape-determining protein MreB
MLNEPSVVALNSQTREILAVGTEAKRMLGRTPDAITAIRPMRDGVIADFESTEQMLRIFIQRVHRRRYFTKPRLVVCVPSGITSVEQRAVKEAGYQAGAGASTSSRSPWPPPSGRPCRCTRRPAT